MSTTTLEAPSTRRVLERATAALAVRRRAEVAVLDSVLAWAHAHVVTTQDEAAGWRAETIPTPGTYAAALFGEKAVPIAGPGVGVDHDRPAGVLACRHPHDVPRVQGQQTLQRLGPTIHTAFPGRTRFERPDLGPEPRVRLEVAPIAGGRGPVVGLGEVEERGRHVATLPRPDTSPLPNCSIRLIDRSSGLRVLGGVGGHGARTAGRRTSRRTRVGR